MTLVSQVRDVRNDVMHSGNFEFADADMKKHLRCMVDLLLEPALQNYNEANTAINEINKVLFWRYNLSCAVIHMTFCCQTVLTY